jgi:hypothetical protein
MIIQCLRPRAFHSLMVKYLKCRVMLQSVGDGIRADLLGSG